MQDNVIKNVFLVMISIRSKIMKSSQFPLVNQSINEYKKTFKNIINKKILDINYITLILSRFLALEFLCKHHIWHHISEGAILLWRNVALYSDMFNWLPFVGLFASSP